MNENKPIILVPSFFLAFFLANVYYIYVIVIFYFESFSAINNLLKVLKKGAAPCLAAKVKFYGRKKS